MIKRYLGIQMKKGFKNKFLFDGIIAVLKNYMLIKEDSSNK